MTGEYELRANFGEEPGLWHGLIGLAHATFGIDLEAWHRGGHANENCLPYAFTCQGEVVAGMLAHRLEVIWDGQVRRAIQFGTVMTHPEHRGRGLAGALLEAGLELGEVDFFFLFANHRVVDFYPRYGFRASRESRFWIDWRKELSDRHSDQPAHLKMPESTGRIREMAARRTPVSRVVGVRGDLHLLLFYCLTVFPQSIYDLGDCLAIYQVEGNTFHLYDVIAPQPLNLTGLLGRIVPPGAARVEFHFTPDLAGLPVEVEPLDDPDSLLFLRPALKSPGPFRFPLTAQA